MSHKIWNECHRLVHRQIHLSLKSIQRPAKQIIGKISFVFFLLSFIWQHSSHRANTNSSLFYGESLVHSVSNMNFVCHNWNRSFRDLTNCFPCCSIMCKCRIVSTGTTRPIYTSHCDGLALLLNAWRMDIIQLIFIVVAKLRLIRASAGKLM